MELDPIDACLHDAMQGIEAIHRHLARQTDDQVGTHLDAALMSPRHCIHIGSITVTPVDPLQSLVVGALQPELQPHLVTPGLIARQQIQYGIRYAIRAGAHAEPHHIAHRQRLFIHPLQILDLGIGTGIGLKVGKIAIVRACAKQGLSWIKLAEGEKHINIRSILNKYREKAQKMESGRSLTIPIVNVHMKMRPDNPLLNNEKLKETRQRTIASMGY